MVVCNLVYTKTCLSVSDGQQMTFTHTTILIGRVVAGIGPGKCEGNLCAQQNNLLSQPKLNNHSRK